MKRRIALAIVIVIVVAGSLAGVKVLQIRQLIAAGESFAPPPETVSTAVVRQEQWQGKLHAIGSITPVQGVTITPEIPGAVREIAFEGGSMVKKGDLLVRLDTSAEEAQLRGLEAQVDLARIELERMRKLRADNTVSQSELDLAEANMKQALANADNIRATIEKKTIRAPFAGRLGIRQVNLGEYLDVGKPIVSLQSLDPIFVDFNLPQQDLPQLKTGMQVNLTTDAYPKRQFEGVLSTINPDLDPGTRSVGLQATLANTNQLLRPGMFARVEVLLPEEQDVLVIPATSVLSAPYGDSVYLVEPKPGKDKAGLTVRQQFVRLGQARGDFVSVAAGLQPGQRLVSAGVFKLRNGMDIAVNNTLAPKAEQAPQPANR